jgi:predicted glycosyltransferase
VTKHRIEKMVKSIIDGSNFIKVEQDWEKAQIIWALQRFFLDVFNQSDDEITKYARNRIEGLC